MSILLKQMEVVVFVLFSLIVATTGKSVRQLNSFSKHCDGNTCDYIVKVSTNFRNNETANIALPRKFIDEIKQLQQFIANLAVVLQSDKVVYNKEIQSLKRNLSMIETKMSGTISKSLETEQSVNQALFKQIKSMRSDIDRLYGVVKGETPSGTPVIANVVSLKSDVPVAYGLDCASLRKSGVNASGIYTLQPDPADNKTRFNAVCDMETLGGGWTLIQRRFDGSDDFYRGWLDYKNGFGNFYHDFWLGLEKMHFLTKHGNNRMRIDLKDWEDEYRYAEFDYVTINDENDRYRIRAGGYNGTAGDPFHTQYYQQRMQSAQFSTFDSDNDYDVAGNCATNYNSGWWFSNCFVVNLNGVWYPSSHYYGSSCNGIVWDMWSNHSSCYSLKHTEIRLRPEHF